MKKGLMVLAAALVGALTACGAIQGTNATFTRVGDGVRLTNPGPATLQEPYMRLEGPGLILGYPCVARAVEVYGCPLADVAPPGDTTKGYVDIVPTSGSIQRGAVDFYLPGSVFLKRLELPPK